MTEVLASRPKAQATAFPALGAASVCHMLNDTLQSVFVAAYPIFKGGFHLSFAQIGLLTLAYQATASLLQPLIGLATDRRPQPYSLPFAMASSLLGLLIIGFAKNYPMLLGGGMCLGIGSSIFHPEASRVARLASGGAHGLAQSIFQVGGNLGTALGPLLVVFLVLPNGQASLAWFGLAALAGIAILTGLSRWSKRHAKPRGQASASAATPLPRGQVGGALSILICLMLSKWVYLASFTSYYVFYLMHHFRLPEAQAQIDLFVFLAAVAVGTVAGGPIVDRIGRKRVIWISIAGVLPFTLALPYVGLPMTIALSALIGLGLASAFPAIVVYAQELMPGRIGMVSGLFFGLAFGLGGLGAAVLGVLADHAGIDVVYRVCSFLPAIGLLAGLLPDIERRAVAAATPATAVRRA